MRQSPTISVVIPAFNRAKTIRLCLDTVLNQTFSPLEVIVVDDCSTDDTVAIVRSYSDSRVRCVVLEKNSGAQAARNRGIRGAKGDWIAFQDSDDEWLPEKLEKQVQALAEVDFDPWTVIHANAIWLDTLTGRRLPVELTVVKGNNVYPLLLSQPAPMFPAMLVSRLALEKIGLLDEMVPAYQEWDTAIRLARYCRFIYLAEPLFIYNLHEGETISKGNLRDITGYQYVIDKFRDDILKVCGQQTWENHQYNLLSKCLKYNLWHKADSCFALIGSHTLKYGFYKLFRMLRLSPQPLFRLVDLGRRFGKGGGSIRP